MIKNTNELRRRYKKSKESAKKMSEANKAYEIKRVREQGKTNWPAFERDATKYLVAFEYMFPGVREELLHYISGSKKSGKSIVLLDLCGIASAPVWADENIGLTLTNEGLSDDEKKRVVVGDILETETRDALEKKIEEPLSDNRNKKSLDVVFFTPKAGVGRYQGNLYAYLQTARLLKMVYANLSPGGFIFIDLNQLDPARYPVNIESVFKKTDASIEYVEGDTAQHDAEGKIVKPRKNVFLIRKPQ